MSKKLVKLVSFMLVLFLCAALLAGCGSKEKEEVSSAQTESPTEAVEFTQTQTDTKEEPQKEDNQKNETDAPNTDAPSNEKSEPPKGDAPVVTIKMTDGGVMTFKLYPEKAPITVENFISLAKEGFYDGLTFHRIIEGFMIQGGDPQGTGMGGSDKKIKGEFSSNGVANDLKHVRGVISMARAMDPNSASSQFFIMHEDAPHLDGSYAAFGMMIDGYDVLDRIATTPVSYDGQTPLEKPVIEKITVE